jgi:hypothetical protein
MQIYKHIDYLGDSVLRVLSYFYKPDNPHHFEWGKMCVR